LALVAVGFGLRLYGLGDYSLWLDELMELDMAQGPLAGLAEILRHAHAATPLDYVIMHAWIGLGRDDTWVRFPAVVWGTLTLPLAYQLGRSLVGPGPGLLLLALLVISPLHVRYSQEVRPYALVLLGTILTVYAFWHLRRGIRTRYFWLLLSGVLISVLSHIFTTLLLATLILFAGLELVLGANWRQSLRLLASLLIAGLLPLIVLLALGWGNAFYYTAVELVGVVAAPEVADALRMAGIENPTPPDAGHGPELSWAYLRWQVVGRLGAGAWSTSLWPVLVMVGLGWLYLLQQKKYRLGLFLLLWLVLPAGITFAFLTYRGSFYVVRHAIYVLPVYLMLLAVGLLALPRWLAPVWGRWPSRALFLITTGLVLVLFGQALYGWYIAPQDRENWRLVAQFIAQNAGPGDAVMAVRTESTMNWYYPPAQAKPGSFDTLENIQAAAAAGRRSWVVLSLFSTGLNARAKAWLSEQQAIEFVLDPIITVYYFGPPGLPREQLLEEVQSFALPRNHTLYASLARDNRRRPDIARRYFELAIASSPDEVTRAEYQAALEQYLSAAPAP
jgi:hypothetical protein